MREPKSGSRKENISWTRKLLNFFLHLFFLDVDPLIWTGRQRPLQEEDVYQDPKMATKSVHDHFAPAWNHQLQQQEPDLSLAVLFSEVNALIVTALLYAATQVFALAGPLLLLQIVAGLQCQTCEKATLYYYCIGLFLSPLFQSLSENHMNFMLARMGTRMRNSLMAAIYRKCLRLSNSSLQAEGLGKIVTLMSNDAQKLQDASIVVHNLWGAPLLIVVVLIFLYFEIGLATLICLGLVLIIVPLIFILVKQMVYLRIELLGWTSKRVGLMSEIISGMQMIKFCVWEDPFQREAMKFRNEEARILRRFAFWLGIFQTLLFVGPVIICIFGLACASIWGHTLTPASAYTTLAFISLLRYPLSLLPTSATQVLNALVGIERIQGFLMRSEAKLIDNRPVQEEEEEGKGEEGVDETRVCQEIAMACQDGEVRIIVDTDMDLKTMPEKGIVVTNGHFTWNEKENEKDAAAKKKPDKAKKKKENHKGKPTASSTQSFDLVEINVSFAPRSLTLIVGGVGSGKSSLLSALIGHMSKVSGNIEISGRMAYVAQSSWIVNQSLRDNILMGLPMDPERYNLALSVSQLAMDLKSLPAEDLTEIGDRGVNLSGGQKQRVSIARAVYHNADIYLLDDPLSAVDSHVGMSLWTECIRGALKDKLVILVTNAIQYLPEADHVIWMDHGRVRAQGTYEECLEQGMVFEELANMTGKEEEDEEAGGGGDVVALDERDAEKGNERRSLGRRMKVNEEAQSGKSVRNLTGDEAREIGAISFKMIVTFFRNGGGPWFWLFLFSLFVFEQATRAYTDRWAGIWFSNSLGKGSNPGWFYIGIYIVFACCFGFFTFFRAYNFRIMIVRAGVTTHNLLLTRILCLPKSFFDMNPSGRILNRFSRDTDIMDTTLSLNLNQFSTSMAILICNLIVIAITTTWFAIAIPPLIAIYVALQRYYQPTANELQRIESTTRSPIYSLFSESLQGVPTIRAYKKEGYLIRVSDRQMTINANAFVSTKLAAAWLAMRLDCLSMVAIAGTGALCIGGSLSPAIAGLALLYALDLSRYLKQGTQMGAQSEANFNSVERILSYCGPDVEVEPPADTPPDVIVPPGWPSRGEISFENVEMRYRPEMPLVLKGVSFKASAGNKVGLLGRTGSGKSSILLCLFRMVECSSGAIVIDGVDIKTLGVRHLRSKLSIIPQDPFLFRGSVRRNLDPLEEYDDDELWEVLVLTGLQPAVASLEGKLDFLVVDGGVNFSLGQRQLICMARAMLKKSKILALDEATANVDLESDALIQQSIRACFKDTTMITVAHRLHTIMDSDMVVVLEGGKVVEMGEPDSLLNGNVEGGGGDGSEGGGLKASSSMFASFVDRTGKSSSKYLRGLAASARMERSMRVESSRQLEVTEEKDN